MKIVIATACSVAPLLLSSQAMAQDTPSSIVPFQGPSISAIAGGERSTLSGVGIDSSGVVYGGQIGFDLRRNHALIGVEAELTGASTHDTYGIFVLTIDDHQGRDIYGGVRAGYVVGPVLFYIKGGYTNAGDDFRVSSPLSTQVNTGHLNNSGYRLGGGAEASVASHISIKAEYRYSDYGQDFRRHQLVAGVSYHF